MLEISDAIISPSPLLLDKYGENKVKIQVEEPIVYPSKYVIHKTGGAVKIGFAGSIDRTADLENVLYEALKEIKNKYKDKVQLEFFGAMPSFSKELNANCFAYSDSYEGYINKLNSLDMGEPVGAICSNCESEIGYDRNGYFSETDELYCHNCGCKMDEVATSER